MLELLLVGGGLVVGVGHFVGVVAFFLVLLGDVGVEFADDLSRGRGTWAMSSMVQEEMSTLPISRSQKS